MILIIPSQQLLFKVMLFSIDNVRITDVGNLDSLNVFVIIAIVFSVIFFVLLTIGENRKLIYSNWFIFKTSMLPNHAVVVVSVILTEPRERGNKDVRELKRCL